MPHKSSFLLPFANLQINVLLLKTVRKLKAALAKEIHKDKRLPCNVMHQLQIEGIC